MSIGWRPNSCRSAFKIAFLAISQARFCCAINRAAQNGSVTPVENAYFVALRTLPALRHCPSGSRSPRLQVRAHGEIRPTHHHQEIREPPALQHRNEHLCDAGRPRVHGQGRRRFSGLRRQDRRRHHPLRARPDHLRAGEQGRPEPVADHFPAPAHPLLRRQHADGGAEISGAGNRIADPGAGKVPQADRHLALRNPICPARRTGPPQHGAVSADLLDVQAFCPRLRAARREPHRRPSPRPAPSRQRTPTSTTCVSR